MTDTVYRMCTHCDRPMRAKGQKKSEHKDTVGWHSLTMCDACYSIKRKSGTTARKRVRGSAGAKRHSSIELVRYEHRAEGWVPVVVKGKYKRITETSIVLDIGEYPRDVWMVCVA